MDIKMKPCPFCGSSNGETISPDEDGLLFCWWCSNCKATGPILEYDWSDEEEDDDDIPNGADIECRRLWSTRWSG
jgi:hypothetical protein